MEGQGWGQGLLPWSRLRGHWGAKAEGRGERKQRKEKEGQERREERERGPLARRRREWKLIREKEEHRPQKRRFEARAMRSKKSGQERNGG